MSTDDLDTRLAALGERPPLTAHGREAALRRASHAAGHPAGRSSAPDAAVPGEPASTGDPRRAASRPGRPAQRDRAPEPVELWPAPARRAHQGQPTAGAPAWARWRLSWRSAAAGGVALALVAGGVVLRATAATPGPPVDVPEPSPPAAVASASPAPATGAAGPAPTAAAARLVVHVAGAVRDPGVVRLPPGARVVDALEAAGGARKGADLTSLNLARPVVDGEQVLVLREGEQPPATTPDAGGSPPGGGAAGAGAAGALVDLNTADAATLDTLPGIGPVLAQRIVEQRASHAFTSVDELVDVPGIGPALLERLRPLVRV